MLKRIKRGVNRVKDKLHRFTDESEPATLAYQPRAAAPHPNPSHAESLEALAALAIVTPHTETTNDNPPSGSAPNISTFTSSKATSDVLASAPPNHPNNLLVNTPKTVARSSSEPEDTQDPDPKPIAPAPTDQGPSMASLSNESSPLSIPPVQIPPESPSSTPDPVNSQPPASIIRPPKPPKGKQQWKDTAWSGLKTLAGVLEKSAEAFSPLKSAVMGLWGSVEIFEASLTTNEAAARSEYRKLRIDLDNICNDISAYVGGNVPPSMTPSVIVLAQGIEEEIQVVMRKGRRNVVNRYVEATDDANEVLQCYRRIQTLLDRISLNANMRVWRVVDEEAARNRLKELPKSMEAQYSSAKSDSLGRNGCTPDTRVDVLKLLHHWAHDSKGQKILWLNGMAGTGKTTIAYSLCEQLERDGQLAASFFCSRQLPSCRDVVLILPTIAYQLSLFSHPFRYALSDALELNPQLHNQPVSRQVKNLIAAPLLKIQETLPANMVVVIDALDECEDADGVGRLLFALLAEAPNLPIKVFLASRPNPKILKQMESEQGERVKSELRLHELERSVVLSDVKTYLASELDELRLQPAQLDALAERSSVLFIYASTVVRYVMQDDLTRSLKRMKIVLSTSNPPNQMHKAIDKLYETILTTELLDESLEISERDDMIRVLRTVICAQEPLSVETIAGLLGMEHADSVRAALRPLLSVLQVSSETGLVTTLHKSFPDYLFDNERSGMFHCDAKQYHAWLAQVCFGHIKSVTPAFNICGLESSFVPDEAVPGIQDRIKTCIPGHLFYACRYWLAHTETAEPAGDVMQDLFWFLSERLLLWMEIMNLKRVTETSASILSALHKWLSNIECSNEILDLTIDAERFVAACASDPIDRHTPHIYTSVLALWPQGRAMSKHYSERMTGIATAVGSAMEMREAKMVHARRDAHAGQIQQPKVDSHAAKVWCVAYSPDGRYIVSGSRDRTTCIWDAHTGQMVGRPLEGHEGAVYSVAYSPDGKHVVSGSGDKTIRIWDVNSGNTVGEPLEGHTYGVWSVAYSPDGARIASGSSDNTIYIWDAHTGQMVGQVLKGHTDNVYSVAYSPDGVRIVSGSEDKTIRIWDAQTGQILGQPMIGHTNVINSVSYSPDGKHIISGSSDHTVRIWDAQTGDMLGQPLEGHTSYVPSVAYSPDGKYIVSGSGDYTIRIWDVRTGKALGQPLEGHTTYVYSVAYSPDGTRIVSGSSDGTIRIWDATTLQRLGELSQSHQDSDRLDSQAPDSSSLVRSSSNLYIQVYEPKTARGFPILPSSDPNAWTLSNDGWVVSHDLKPLLWVPHELQDTLLRYGNTCLISKKGCWKLDLSKAKFGTDWKECYRPSNV